MFDQSTKTMQLTPIATTFADDFAGRFGIFNLEIPPPRWAKEFMRFDWAGARFEDETSEAQELYGNLFFVVAIGAGAFVFHLALITTVALTGLPVPKGFQLPLFEAKLFTAMSMGLLNVSAGALVNSHVSDGWRLVAAFEVLGTLSFIAWLFLKGREFTRKVAWSPAKLALTERERAVFREFTNSTHAGEADLRITLGDFLQRAHLVGQANEDTASGKELVSLVTLFRELDIDHNGLLDEEEFRLGVASKRLNLPKATLIENFHAFACANQPILGTYSSSIFSPSGVVSSTEPWGR